MTPIRALLFDLGNVLVHFSHERMCQQMAACCGLRIEDVRWAVFESGLQWRFERGEITRQEFSDQFVRLTGARVAPEELSRAGSDIFWRNESIEPVVRALLDAGYSLVLVSNTNVAHFEWVEQRFEVVRLIPNRALSYQVGACKPSPAIYGHAVSLAGVPPAECLYVDDIVDYVEVARTLGFDAVQYTTTPAFVRALESRGIEVPRASP